MVHQANTESALYEQVAHYLRLKHPDVPFHFDLSGLWTPSHKQRNLYGRLNKRAWPDLFIAFPIIYTDVPSIRACGLFLELKREGTKLKKRNDEWVNEHVGEQARVLEHLQDQGFIAQFAVGFDETVEMIESYLGGAA